MRYYLENSAARSDLWVKEVSADLFVRREVPALFQVQHFKEFSANGEIAHRSFFLPGPNEALAEADLLTECSKHPKAFDSPDCVFSYRFAKGRERSGVYAHYMDGLKERHDTIANACDNWPNGIVSYTDIKKFYPSIGIDLAQKTWAYWAARTKLGEKYIELGHALIESQARVSSTSGRGLLVGPMFNHLLANLVLRDLDLTLSQDLSVRYVRYVDDITLIGEPQAVAKALDIVKNFLETFGLCLHDDSSDKKLEVSTREWLEGRDDYYQSPRAVSWMSLIGDLKRFLVQHPGQRESLQRAFRDEGFRIPVRDYSNAVFERSYLERLDRLARMNWFRRNAQQITIRSLLEQAMLLRDRYMERQERLLEQSARVAGYSRKRLIPKLRYRAGRLAYLARETSLAKIAESTKSVPELHLHSEVLAAIGTGKLDRILLLGTNAAQAVAQPLRAAMRTCSTALPTYSETAQQSLAVILLNGVTVQRATPEPRSELLRFAQAGADSDLMQSGNPFIRELACLHGVSEEPRHPRLLETAYDEDEDLALDAAEQLQQSVSGL